MSVIGVIPARFKSTRFEGKVLADIGGKPMIQHVFEKVQECSLIDKIIIACDDEKVLEVAKGFGSDAVMTSIVHESGSDRIAEVVKDLDFDIVVNIQGDEPMVNPVLIDELVKALQEDESVDIATPIKEIEETGELVNSNVVKVVVGQDGQALYFSRAAIPFDRDGGDTKAFKHIGLYAYRKSSLLKFTELPQSTLEKQEKLEQLRALENGMKIKIIVTDTETIGVDTKEDLEKVKEILE